MGYGINSNIEKCYSTLDSFYSNYGPTFSGHTGDYNSGGIAGECRNVNIANCFYIGDI